MKEEQIAEVTPEDLKKLDRPALMKVTGKLIRHLDKKSIAGRLVDSDIEKMRDSKTRLLIEAIKTHGSLLKDEQIDKLEARISALEDRL